MLLGDRILGCPGARAGNPAAFTLLELLAVTALLAVVILPLCLGARAPGDFGAAANEVASLLESAASYSRANNTHVWVGFFEEDSGVAPGGSPKPGVGRIVISVVASKDGTQIIDPSGPGTGIDPVRLVQVFKLLKIENAHLADVPAPASPDPGGGGESWNARPEVQTPHVIYRIGETTPAPTIFPFVYPVGNFHSCGQYTFAKTLHFSPDGEAVLNTSYSLVPWIEIGLQPAHGNLKTGSHSNCAAIQVSGVTGGVRVYRP